MKRLDRLLADYDKEREKAKTLKEFQKASKKLVEAIQALPGEKTNRTDGSCIIPRNDIINLSELAWYTFIKFAYTNNGYQYHDGFGRVSTRCG